MKRTFKIIMALSLALCMILPCLIITAGSSGEISVTIYNQARTSTVSGISVNLCQIASVDTGGSFVFTDDFTDIGIEMPQRTDTDTAEEAETIYQYIKTNKISYTTLTTSSSGKCVFTSLDEGLYIVFGKSGQKVSFDPYLVFLPTYVGGEILYSVDSAPKTTKNSGGGGGSDYTSVSVTKQWDDNSNSSNLRPLSVEVTLFRDGIAYKKVTLSASNSWKYTFTLLPVGSEYTVEEKSVEHYNVSYSGNAESGYVITNTYEEISEPTEPTEQTEPTEDYTIPIEESTDPPEGHTDPPEETTEQKERHTDPSEEITRAEEETEPKLVTEEYHNLTVFKGWNDNGEGRPTYVTVQLIENGVVVQTAALSDANDWSYTFMDLPLTNDYDIKEIIPPGYTPVYSKNYNDDVLSSVLITNKKGNTKEEEEETKIPQTGDNILLCYILSAAGAALVLIGLTVLFTGREKR